MTGRDTTPDSPEPASSPSRGVRIVLFAVAGAAAVLAIVWLAGLRGRGAATPAGKPDAASEPAVVVPSDEMTAVSAIFRDTTYMTLDRLEDLGGGGLRAHVTFHGSPQGSSLLGIGPGSPAVTPKDVLRDALLAELGLITVPLVRRGVREVDAQVELIVQGAGGRDKRVVVEEDRIALASASLDGADDGGVPAERLAPLVKELRSEWSKYEVREEPTE